MNNIFSFGRRLPSARRLYYRSIGLREFLSNCDEMKTNIRTQFCLAQYQVRTWCEIRRRAASLFCPQLDNPNFRAVFVPLPLVASVLNFFQNFLLKMLKRLKRKKQKEEPPKLRWQKQKRPNWPNFRRNKLQSKAFV